METVFDAEDFKAIEKQFKQREEDLAYLKSILQAQEICALRCQREILAIQFQKDRYRREIEDRVLTTYAELEILNKTPEHQVVVDFAESVDAIIEISKERQKSYNLMSDFED